MYCFHLVCFVLGRLPWIKLWTTLALKIRSTAFDFRTSQIVLNMLMQRWGLGLKIFVYSVGPSFLPAIATNSRLYNIFFCVWEPHKAIGLPRQKAFCEFRTIYVR